MNEVEGVGSPGGVGVEDAFPSAAEGRGGGGDCSAVVDPSFGFRVVRFRGGTGSAGDADADDDSPSAAEAGGGGCGISGGFFGLLGGMEVNAKNGCYEKWHAFYRYLMYCMVYENHCSCMDVLCGHETPCIPETSEGSWDSCDSRCP